MKLFLILLSVSIFPNVYGQLQKEKFLQADSIQVFISNGWDFVAATKIDSRGVRIFNTSGPRCYIDTLNTSEIDSINNFLLKLRSEKIDTLYDGRCEDCAFYFGIINYRDTVLRSKIIGAGEFNNDLTSFLRYVMNIKRNERNLINTWINYEATKFMMPPATPIDVKFLPPTRKEQRRYNKDYKRSQMKF
jgi:hypothetical protein